MAAADVVGLVDVGGHLLVEIAQVFADEVVFAEEVVGAFYLSEGLGPPFGVLMFVVQAPGVLVRMLVVDEGAG